MTEASSTAAVASAPASVTHVGDVADRPIGLREKHNRRTRAAIRAAAMELFDAQGYAQTTVAQIAEAAEVSHTTFFRYFQSKEQVVVSDDLDEVWQDALTSIPQASGASTCCVRWCGRSWDSSSPTTGPRTRRG